MAGMAFGVVTTVMVIIAVIFAIVNVHRNWTFTLLIINLFISCVVTLFLLWWYRKGILAPNKMWFLFVTGGILVFQCLSTIIYVTKHKTFTDGSKYNPAFTVVAPVTIITPPPRLLDLVVTENVAGYLQVPHG
ncbi:uncharacterized protein [Apostichopus japonicus]